MEDVKNLEVEEIEGLRVGVGPTCSWRARALFYLFTNKVTEVRYKTDAQPRMQVCDVHNATDLQVIMMRPATRPNSCCEAL